MKLLIVEDDKDIRELVTDFLSGEGYEVESAADGRTAERMIEKGAYGLILLDLMLPNASGFEVLKQIRRTDTVPVIIVTAKGSDTDKMLGFSLGADDYLTKPFSLVELLARVKANIRRATLYNQGNSPQVEVIIYRKLQMDLSDHTVKVGACDVKLTKTEFEILRLFLTHQGQAFSKEQLYQQVWKEPYYGNENVLNSHINRLRAKLSGADEEAGTYIKTLWGIGYKMEAEA